VEVGSNTSTVSLRVVVDDEKGNLKSERVNMVTSPKGLGPEKTTLAKARAACTKDRPVLSSRRTTYKNKTVAVKE
jgi:hypothetical protein